MGYWSKVTRPHPIAGLPTNSGGRADHSRRVWLSAEQAGERRRARTRRWEQGCSWKGPNTIRVAKVGLKGDTQEVGRFS